MPKMSESQLVTELDLMSVDATGNNSAFISENERLLERYNGDPYGDEKPEESKVVSNDEFDVVESDMVSLTRVFLGPSEILRFKPVKSSDPEDVKEADSKTKYVNWQIREQDWSFEVLSGFIKNAEIHKLSVVKYFIEEEETVEEHKKTGLSDEELAVFQDSLKGEDVKNIEIVREEQNGEDEENTVVIKVERKKKCVKITNVPLENFRMSKNATNKNDAQLVGDVELVTRGELLARGINRDIVDSLQLAGTVQENARLKDIRDQDEGGEETDQALLHWANEKVEIQDLYPKIDYDGDGIAERRHILRSKDVIIENEVFNHVPYAMMSSILMPHKAIGKSRAEITCPTGRIKTSILRGINNNIMAVNNPRIAANKNVHMDDLLVMRPNGVIRTKDQSNPGQNMFAIEVPYIGDKALQVIQYWDQARAQKTGSLMTSQGLEADDLGKETATRFEGVREESKGKIELVARVMSETGFRQLFEGVAWLDSNFQNTKVEIEVLGEELAVDPRDWKYKHSLSNKVGLGAGDDAQVLKTMGGLWAIHQQLREANSPMTDEVKRFNILKSMTHAAGLAEESLYFNNPERPKELITAQNEIMSGIIEQLQQQVAALQNPLAEAETIKQQGNLIKAESDARIETAKHLEDQRQFNIEAAQKQDQFNKKLAAQITELELKFDEQLPGGVQ